jgi:hypothetical protein
MIHAEPKLTFSAVTRATLARRQPVSAAEDEITEGLILNRPQALAAVLPAKVFARRPLRGTFDIGKRVSCERFAFICEGPFNDGSGMSAGTSI